MELKFIGTDGSMGLKHGEVYDVSVVSLYSETHITVKWYDSTQGKGVCCPYSSPAAFAANWAKPGQNVTVRKKDIATTNWLTRGISEKRLEKEKTKALKRFARVKKKTAKMDAEGAEE